MIRIISGCKRGNNRWGGYNPPGSCQGVSLKICFLIYFFFISFPGNCLFWYGIILLELALLETAWCVRQTGCLALNCYFSSFFPCFVSPQHMPPTSRMLFSSLPTILVMAISHTLEARRGRRTATAWHGRECASPMPTRRRRSAHQPATASSQAATIGGAR